MEAHAVVDDHLPVEVVEGPDPEVAVLQQLGDGDGPVVNPVEERRHSGRLVQGPGPRRVVMNPVVTLPVGEHGRGPSTQPCVRRLGRVQRFLLQWPPDPLVIGVERTGRPQG